MNSAVDMSYLRWPYGFKSALIVVPLCWVVLLLALYGSERWVHWAGPALRGLILWLGALASLLPLLLILAGRSSHRATSLSSPLPLAAMLAPASPPLATPAAAPASSATPTSAIGSAVPVPDYDKFREGDTDPYLGKRIRHLTYKSKRFIVYLDEDLAVEWACTGHFDQTPNVGRVLNRVAELMALPVAHLSQEDRFAFRTLVAEAVVRVLRDRNETPGTPVDDNADAEAAHDALDKALNFLAVRNAEISRWWYLSASVLAAGALLLLVFLLWLLRSVIEPFIGTSAFDVMMAAGAGSAGALLSVLVGSRSHTADTSIRRNINYFQGAARILAGTIGAVLIALAIKGNFMLGQVATADSKELFLFLCMVAGWSERLVPNLIERFEATQAAPTVGARPTR